MIDPRDANSSTSSKATWSWKYIDGGGRRQRETIREGDVFLLPANTPHSPSGGRTRWAWWVEPVRGPEEKEGYAWYCERCDAKLYEMVRGDGDLLLDLRRVSERFNASDALRTCKACGYVRSRWRRGLGSSRSATDPRR